MSRSSNRYPALGALPPLTVGLITVCVAMALWSRLGSYLYPMGPFFLTEYFRGTGMQAALGGQFWRFLTPIFLHFGLAHIAFNMLWLWQLGGPFERRLSTAELLSFVILTGVASNLAQYFFDPYVPFGGMSGVVYGLLGYFWVQGRINPRFGMALHRPIVVMMLIWFAVCWLGLIGNIANMAHTAGLLIGAGWGFFSARLQHP